MTVYLCRSCGGESEIVLSATNRPVDMPESIDCIHHGCPGRMKILPPATQLIDHAIRASIVTYYSWP